MAYGGRQAGQARLEVDENGQQQVVYDDVEVSPNSQHQSVGAAFGRTAGQLFDPRKSMLPYLLPYAMWAGGAGAATGAAAAQAAPSAAAPAAAGLPTGLLPGVSPFVGAPAIGAGAPAALAVAPNVVAPVAAKTASFGAKAMANPFVQNMLGKAGEAIPSLVMSAFMGPSKDEKATSASNRALVDAQRKKLEQEAMFRDWMRPMMQQAMMGMMQRLPTHLQGGMMQNFPQFPAPQGQNPRQSPFTGPGGRNAMPRM